MAPCMVWKFLFFFKIFFKSLWLVWHAKGWLRLAAVFEWKKNGHDFFKFFGGIPKIDEFTDSRARVDSTKCSIYAWNFKSDISHPFFQFMAITFEESKYSYYILNATLNSTYASCKLNFRNFATWVCSTTRQ